MPTEPVNKKTKLEHNDEPDLADDAAGQRRSSRASTMQNSRESETLAEQRSTTDTSNHVRADGRAVADNLAPDTASTNATGITTLEANKAFKNGTVRIHFKGDRDGADKTTGTRLGGNHIARRDWTNEQKAVRQNLGNHLAQRPGFVQAPHANGSHASEIAHARPQHAGGLSDPLGAQPASWHSNVQDMAREEAQAKLFDKYGDDVRLKSTIYVHEDGEHAGTVKAARHKIYFKNSSNDSWEKKMDYLQDGHRDNINKSEARQIKAEISNLGPHSDTIISSRSGNAVNGIDASTSLDTQKAYTPSKNNDTRQSPYFTDLSSGSGPDSRSASKEQAHNTMSTILSKAANPPATLQPPTPSAAPALAQVQKPPAKAKALS